MCHMGSEVGRVGMEPTDTLVDNDNRTKVHGRKRGEASVMERGKGNVFAVGVMQFGI